MRSVLIGMFLLLATSLAAQPEREELPPVLAVEFGNRSITFSEVSPGGTVVVFGVARETLDTIPVTPATVVRAEALTDDDRDGVVRLELSVPVPRLGMWAAVELERGARVLFASPGFEPLVVALSPDLIQRDGGNQLRKIEWPFGEIDLFVVRPGKGAWRFYASKSSRLDENRENGKQALRFDIAKAVAIGKAPATLGTFLKGDIVAIFDRRELQFGMMEVTQ